VSGRTLRFDRMRGTELAGETYRSRHLFIVSPTSLYPLPLVTSSSYRPQNGADQAAAPFRLLRLAEISACRLRTHIPGRLAMTINVKTETTMTSTFPTAGPAASLSLLVLVPSSAHIHQFPTPLAPPSRPAPLTSRQSGSTVPSMRQLSAARRSDGQERKVDEEAEIDKVMAAGRRLSLAPGIGTGTEIHASERFKSSLPPLSDYSIATPPVAGSSYEAPPSFGTPFTPEEQTPPPAFGAKRGSVSRVPASRRRPQTAAGPAIPLSPAMMVGVSRGSIALPSGSGLGFGGGGNVGKTRPGWEGDEVVRVLRNSGLEGECNCVCTSGRFGSVPLGHRSAAGVCVLLIL